MQIDDLQPITEEMDNIPVFRGIWPGAKIVWYVEPHEATGQPVNSWVLLDESDNRWLVRLALVSHPQHEVMISFMYSPEDEFSEIAILHAQYTTQKEFFALFKVVHALRQGYAMTPGRKQDPAYDLAANLITSGKKNFTQILDMFPEDDRDAARKALARKDIFKTGRIR